VREFDLVDHSPAHDAVGEKIDPDALSNLRKGMKMMSHIMDRTHGRRSMTVTLILGLIMIPPGRAEASKISSPDAADALREVATASSSPLANSTIAAILNAGTPVAETTTTTLSDGTTQTADLMIVPNTSNGTVTTTKNINLADGDTEKAVDVSTVSGNRSSNMVTTTLPDGSVQTKNETDVTKGDETLIKATVSVAGGGTQTVKGETVQKGSQSVTTETITNPAGQVYHDRIAITHTGALSQTETNTTTGPGGSISTVKSVTSTVLDPISVSQSATEAGLIIPSPATATMAATQAPNLEAQVVTPSASGSDLKPTVLPAALPEPGSLLIFSVMLGAAGLCHRFKMSRSSRKFGSHPITTPS
jgi:hypothetical protein